MAANESTIYCISNTDIKIESGKYYIQDNSNEDEEVSICDDRYWVEVPKNIFDTALEAFRKMSEVTSYTVKLKLKT